MDNKVDRALNALNEASRSIEFSMTDLLSGTDVQKAILRNLIEVKYLLMQIIRNADRK